ncbi:hypothetical protein [Paraburkholderia diazotrophica]|uniref:Uncharacterized protein n=1 Tax=Paraburkholderia diazotrophica TaxID=667676 RepID=A0A1H6TR21_9BURK|nr:hypothetical protein [Paraburkholderia diazotrophica]SEI80644.1 hypothetical protein SAMN05192539_1004170 [Paraburkholderia diazotrophica]
MGNAAHEEVIASINSQISETNALINAALVAGTPTDKLRKKLATLHGDLKTAQEFEAAGIADEQAKDEAFVLGAGTEIAASTIAAVNAELEALGVVCRIEQGGDRFAEVAHRIAVALRIHEKVREKIGEAAAAVERLETRINECAARRATITAARLDGKSSDREVNEFVALAADIDALNGLLYDARAKLDGIDDSAEKAAVERLRADMQQLVSATLIEAVTVHVAQAEIALLDGIRKLHRTGLKHAPHRGSTPRSHYLMNADLDFFCRTGALR